MDKDAVAEKMGMLQSGGGTDIYSAMIMGADALSGISTRLKHMILLTDG